MFTANTTIPKASVNWHTTIFALLQVMGLSGWALFISYATLAITITLLALRLATERNREASDTVCFGMLASFLVSPHALFYDLTVIIAPLLGLARKVPSSIAKLILATFLCAPYLIASVQILYLKHEFRPYWFSPFPVFLAFMWVRRYLGVRPSFKLT